MEIFYAILILIGIFIIKGIVGLWIIHNNDKDINI